MSAFGGLDEIMSGAVAERFQHSLQQVIHNVLDLNTDAKKARKITMSVTIKPNEKRELADFSIETKENLAPRTPIETTIMFGVDENGEMGVAEFKPGIPPGQLDMDGGEYGKITPITKIR